MDFKVSMGFQEVLGGYSASLLCCSYVDGWSDVVFVVASLACLSGSRVCWIAMAHVVVVVGQYRVVLIAMFLLVFVVLFCWLVGVS